jgi:hypothetical protein
MESIRPPKTLKFYQLIKMSIRPTITFSPAGNANGTYIGLGFFRTLEEAEWNRTAEALKDTDNNSYHIFELEFPNPTYTE